MQHKLRLLKEDQLDPSMKQSGPFLQSLKRKWGGGGGVVQSLSVQ